MLKFKKIVYALIALVIIIAAGCKSSKSTQNNNTTANEPTRAAVQENVKSLLWEISGKDLKQPSFLYGTIHLIPKSEFFLTDATQKALEASQKLTFEINMKDMNNPLALLGVMTKALMPGGKRLKDYLTEDDYSLVQHHFDSLGLPLKILERVKPMFLSVMVGNDGEKISLEGTTDTKKSTSYEMELMQIGEKQKKEFAGLETVDFQMSIFDSIPYQAQADMLVKTIKSKGGGEDEYQTMIDMYKAQDIEAMSKMLGSEDQTDLAKYEKMLITSRNRNWIPIMQKMMKEKQTFFAVGAGHLGGAMGVVSLLKQAGYKLKPLH
jgi:uncharacterized protein